MHEQPVLSDAEWDVVLELLKADAEALPVEIHHTTLGERQELHERLRLVTQLIGRLQTAKVR